MYVHRVICRWGMLRFRISTLSGERFGVLVQYWATSRPWICGSLAKYMLSGGTSLTRSAFVKKLWHTGAVTVQSDRAVDLAL